MAKPKPAAGEALPLLPIAADGLSFTPPGLWDLAQFRYGEQHFRDGGLFAQFDDLLRERLIFRWYNKAADPKRMAIAYVANLADEIKRNLPAGIPPPEIVPSPFEEIVAPALSGMITKCVFKSGELFGRLYTFPWPDTVVKRTVLLCLAYSAAENNNIVERWEKTLLESLTWEPPSAEGWRRWALGGMQFEAPAALTLWDAEAYAGQFRIALRPAARFLRHQPGEELVLFRSGLAETALAKSSLQAVTQGWLKVIQGPRSPVLVEGTRELKVENIPTNPLSKLAARAKSISKRARGNHLQGVVRQVPDVNALTGLFWFGHGPRSLDHLTRLDRSLRIRGMEANSQMPVEAGLPAANKMALPALDAKGQPMMTRAWQWRTLVIRNPAAASEPLHDGLRLKLPVEPTRMTSALRRFSGMGRQPLPDRVLELDEIGAELWAQFDGKVDLWQITSQFSRKYHLSIRESERLIWQHLQNMVKRGIIGLGIPRMQTQEALFENAGT